MPIGITAKSGFSLQHDFPSSDRDERWLIGSFELDCIQRPPTKWIDRYPLDRPARRVHTPARTVLRARPRGKGNERHVDLRGRWLVRRLAPDCSRIELSSLPTKHDAMRLLHAMGFETANVHLGTRDAKSIEADLRKRPPLWLQTAALAMVRSVEADWKRWRQRR